MTHAPRKRFGQHFLGDEAVIDRILTVLSPKTREHVIEIGPGQGALTLPLLKLVDQLEVIELDRDLIPLLEARCTQHPGLHIYAADVLEFDFARVQRDERLLRVLGNLPYNISTPLIFHLLSFAPCIADMLFMLQREVAERMAATPGSKIYGRLSVMVQYYCQVEVLFHVPNQAFYPPPKVQSSIVKLVPYHADQPYTAHDEAHFALIVKEAFGQRRKTLRNSLKKWVDDATWERLALPSALRPEDLSVEDFVLISNEVKNQR